MDWGGALTAILIGFLLPVFFAGIRRVARGQRPRQTAEGLVFGPSLLISLLALAVILMGTAFLVGGLLGYIEDWDLTFALVSTGFVALGLVIFYSVGEIRLTEVGIEKRILWMRSSMTWGELKSLTREAGQWQGWTLISTNDTVMRISEGHAAPQVLIAEILRRAPALRQTGRTGG